MVIIEREDKIKGVFMVKAAERPSAAFIICPWNIEAYMI